MSLGHVVGVFMLLFCRVSSFSRA